jgi:hypothetical protein
MVDSRSQVKLVQNIFGPVPVMPIAIQYTHAIDESLTQQFSRRDDQSIKRAESSAAVVTCVVKTAGRRTSHAEFQRLPSRRNYRSHGPQRRVRNSSISVSMPVADRSSKNAIDVVLIMCKQQILAGCGIERLKLNKINT